ncbi:MAG: hypothetical protein JSR83_10115 [Proteobacteria bacterium]|nr:hypothetical protein [Pseudomonadota bacterium]
MNTHSVHETGILPPSSSVAPDLLPAIPETLPPGYRLPDDCTDPDLIQRYIAAQMGRTVETCLEIGRGLIALKTTCAHGEFLNRLRELGINQGVSSRFIAAFRRFSNVATSRHLATVGKQSKLFELLPLDDEQIEELAVQGQTGPLVLSEIPSMTVKAVRETVRKIREERKQVSDALLDDKRQQLVGASLHKKKCLVDETFDRAEEALQPGDRIESHLARRPGTVVKVYPDGSACVCWDEGEPQPEGMGHERVPRQFLIRVSAQPEATETPAPDVTDPDGQAPLQCDLLVRAFPAFRVDDRVEHLVSGRQGRVHSIVCNVGVVAVCFDGDEGGPALCMSGELELVEPLPDSLRVHEPQPGGGTGPDGLEHIRRVDTTLRVHFGGRMFDVSQDGVQVGDAVFCRADDNGPFIYVRRAWAAQPEFIAPLVRHNDGPSACLDGQRSNRPGLSVGDRVAHREDGALGYVHSLPGGAAVRVVWDSGTANRPSLCLEEEIERTGEPPAAMALGGTAEPRSGSSQPGDSETAEACNLETVQLNHRRAYLLERMRVVLRHADALEMNAIDDALEALVNDVQSGRYVPGLVADDYELTRRFWIEGGVK